jgi:outer membrane lipoprotein-sorting protein
MKNLLYIFTALFITASALCGWAAQYPDGEALLDRIDANMSSKTRIFTAEMVIHGRRGSRTVTSKTWAKGEEKAFTEYLAPAREKGTKMLKLTDRLWMYSPSTDRTIQISGHMLRQSVMGSDLSYEDMLEDSKLRNYYAAEVVGTEVVDQRACWVVTLTATKEDVAYYKRRLWVDQERLIPLKATMYARSGKLLKKMEFKDISRIQGRWYPKRMLFKDMLKTGQGTHFIFKTISFNDEIPERVFSKASLRR